MYWFSYVCMYIYLCIYEWIFLKCVVGLTITFDCLLTFLPCCDASSLLCSLINCVLSQVSKGRTHLKLHLLEPIMQLPWLTAALTPLLQMELSYLPLCEITVKALPYDPLLWFLHQMVWGLIGTSYSGDPLTCWWVQHRQHFGTRRRDKWRVESSHLFWISTYPSGLTSELLFWNVCLMEMISLS